LERLESAHGRLESWKRDPEPSEFLELSAELKRLRDELESAAADHATVVELVHDFLELEADEDSAREEFQRAWMRSSDELRAALPRDLSWSGGTPLLPRFAAEVYRVHVNLRWRDERVSSVLSTLFGWGYRLGRSSS
jgi:hypothetical protein